MHSMQLEFPVFGPSKAAAQLEGPKVFAKDLMKNTISQPLRMVCSTG